MTQSSDEKNKRRLIQIGFAALMARKRSPHKQYLYERRGENEFVFEPVLKQNEADMNSEEYMKKKYYSQVVYGQEERVQVGLVPVKEDIWRAFNPVLQKLEELVRELFAQK